MIHLTQGKPGAGMSLSSPRPSGAALAANGSATLVGPSGPGLGVGAPSAVTRTWQPAHRGERVYHHRIGGSLSFATRPHGAWVSGCCLRMVTFSSEHLA